MLQFFREQSALLVPHAQKTSLGSEMQYICDHIQTSRTFPCSSIKPGLHLRNNDIRRTLSPLCLKILKRLSKSAKKWGSAIRFRDKACGKLP